MKLVYYVSELSRSSRPTARHIDNGNGEPLCGGNGHQPLLWAQEEGEPTCKVCLDLSIIGYKKTDDTHQLHESQTDAK